MWSRSSSPSGNDESNPLENTNEVGAGEAEALGDTDSDMDEDGDPETDELGDTDPESLELWLIDCDGLIEFETDTDGLIDKLSETDIDDDGDWLDDAPCSWMVNVRSLTSIMSVKSICDPSIGSTYINPLILIFAKLVTGSVTTHWYNPSFSVFPIIVSQDDPLFLDNSIFTSLNTSGKYQVISYCWPIIHIISASDGDAEDDGLIDELIDDDGLSDKLPDEDGLVDELVDCDGLTDVDGLIDLLIDVDGLIELLAELDGLIDDDWLTDGDGDIDCDGLTDADIDNDGDWLGDMLEFSILKVRLLISTISVKSICDPSMGSIYINPLILIFAWVVMGPTTTNWYRPSFSVDAIISSQVDPLFLDNSILTLLKTSGKFQVILYCCPIIQTISASDGDAEDDGLVEDDCDIDCDGLILRDVDDDGDRLWDALEFSI
jgi:hypothetical protein